MFVECSYLSSPHRPAAPGQPWNGESGQELGGCDVGFLTDPFFFFRFLFRAEKTEVLSEDLLQVRLS